MKAAKHIMRYLIGTKNATLKYSKHDDGIKLVGYCDASYASDVDARKSITGYVFFLANGPISWSSKRQSAVALSTAEAEYMAASAAAQEAIWLKQLLDELGFTQSAVSILSDNQAAIAIANNPVHHSRAKHIDIRYHFIRSAIANKQIKLSWCSTTDMIADIFTNPLAATAFNGLRHFLIKCTH
jgi:hypothetical protein